MAESDLEGDGKKIWIDRGGQALWASMSAAGGGIQMDWITARSDFGESLLSDIREKPAGNQVLWSES